jgi:6-phosphofructo-2-kinase
MDEDAAMKDFMERRDNYMAVYEPVTENDGPFCKIINSKQFIVNNIRGYLSLKVCAVEVTSSAYDAYSDLLRARILKFYNLATVFSFAGRSLRHELAYASSNILPNSTWTVRIQPSG